MHIFNLINIKAALCLSLMVGTLAMMSEAVADERYSPVTDALVTSECGACHMTFQPEMLPARSWEKMMDDLGNHFGEDASFSADKKEKITAFHVKHAADQSWIDGKFMRGLSDKDAPLRISETPYWLHEHDTDEVPARAWKDPKVGSKANCLACHRYANKGFYDYD